MSTISKGSGEGSRGGTVTGHDAKGNPIYGKKGGKPKPDFAGTAKKDQAHASQRKKAGAAHDAAMQNGSHDTHEQAAHEHAQLAAASQHPKLKANATRLAAKHYALAHDHAKKDLEKERSKGGANEALHADRVKRAKAGMDSHKSGEQKKTDSDADAKASAQLADRAPPGSFFATKSGVGEWLDLQKGSDMKKMCKACGKEHDPLMKCDAMGKASDKPEEQVDVEADEGGDDEGSEDAAEEGGEKNEGPPSAAEMSKGLGAWLTNEDNLDAQAEREFEKSYAGLVDGYDALSKGGPYIGARGGKWANPEHTIPWNEKKHAGKKTPKAKEHSPEDSRELQLFTENDGDLHRQQHEPIRRNLVNKMASGKYDHAQATVAMGHLMNSASKKYAKDMGDGSGHQFDPATRNAAAKRMADDFHDEAKAGEHDHLLQKKHAGKSLKTQKSMSATNSLTDWLSKAGGTIPGASDYGTGKAKQGLNEGVRDGLDATEGYTGKPEVQRKEEGGKLDGVGTTNGANDAGQATVQTTTKGGAAGGKTDQFTPDDPNDTDKMKDELGMISMPGAPATSFNAMRAGSGMPSGGAKAASAPRAGAAGMGEARSQGGPTLGPNHGAPQKSAAATTHDPSGGATGGSGQPKAGSSPQVGASGLNHNASGQPFTKGIDEMTRPADMQDATSRGAVQTHAAQVARLRKGEDDIVLGLGVAGVRPSPVQDMRRITVMEKGGVFYSDQADQETVEYLEKSEFGYQGPPPSLGDVGGALVKGAACTACGGVFMKALTVCPQCGVDTLTGMSKAETVVQTPQHQVPQTHSKGSGLRRAPVEADLFAPDGLRLDD